MRVLNKNGAVEGISWIAGLIIIIMIVIFSIVIYNAGEFGKRGIIKTVMGSDNVEVVLNNGEDDFYDALLNQRVGASLFASDFSSSKKGWLISRIYLNSFYSSIGPVSDISFDDLVLGFVGFVPYNYFSVYIDNSRYIVGTKLNLKNILGCKFDSSCLFYLPSKNKEYHSIGVLTRGCK